jgi:TolA-binding protein
MSTRLVKHQKMTKRQIKEDALVTAAFRATEIWENHGRTILVAAGAVVLLAVLAIFVMRTRAQSEERAQGELFRAVIAVNQGDFVSAQPMLKELIDNSPGTRAARDAQRYLADVLMAQGKYAEAATAYRATIDKAGGDATAALAGYWGLAAALESDKKFAEAAAAYAEAAKRSESDNERGRAMLGQARSYLRAGQTDAAVKIYREIVRLPLAEQPIQDAANVRLGELQAPGIR